jgi:oxygen-independent coproporphyrinogen-3 oxidase
MARRAGFTNLGMDLMHSIPGETTEMWHDDLHEALGLAPDHISAYPLTIEEGTPLQREVQEKGVLLPDEDDALRMFRDTESILVGAGYEHYEIANFARPGFRSRHNQVYWRHAPYLGFGTGAHSFLPYPQWGARWCNVTPMTRYNELLFSGSLPSEEPQILTRNDAMSEWLFLGLRLLEGVSHDKFRAEFGIGLDSAYPGVIPRLMKAGLLEQDATLHLTRRGVEMANVVFRAFL